MASIRFLPVVLSALLVGCGRSGSIDPADPAAVPAGGWFTDVTADAGIDFDLDRSVAGDYYMPDSMGPGCGLLDYDGDGDLDIYLVNCFRDPDGNVLTPLGANRLYRNDGAWTFSDVTEASGAGDEGYGQGIAVGDIDNDGDVDLYVSNYGPDRLYRNEGDGTFVDVTDAAGIAADRWCASAGFFDYDGDGFLDLYVTTYLDLDESKIARDAAGRREYPSPGAFPGVPDYLYRNDGDGTFTDVTTEAGIAGTVGRGLGVLLDDIDGDGLPDAFIANDGEINAAWINDGAGGFENRARIMGLSVNSYGMPEASMGIASGDYDEDGDLDFYATHLVRESNTLYEQISPGRYEDVTLGAGLAAATIDFTGFGTAFADVDLDGDIDILVVNGRILRKFPHPGALTNEHWRPYAEPNLLFLNDGDGTFTEAGAEGGAFVADAEVSRGLALGDLDGDGDVDAIVANGSGTLKVYRNDAPRRGAWLVVRAVDPAHGRDAVGALVEVTAGGHTRRRSIGVAQGYLSRHDPRAHFGLGPVTAIDAITVRWPDGARERFEGGAPDRAVVLVRGGGLPEDGPRNPGGEG